MAEAIVVSKKSSKNKKKQQSNALYLYKLQQRVKHPLSFIKFIVILFFAIAFAISSILIGFAICTDSMNLKEIISHMCETLNLPNIINLFFIS